MIDLDPDAPPSEAFLIRMERRHAETCPCGPDDPCPTALTLRASWLDWGRE